MLTFSYFLLHILLTAAQSLWDLLPYVVAGTALGEALRFTRYADLLAARTRKNPVLSIFSAVVIGAVSPLCTYGTIPVVLQMGRSGMPVYVMLSFLVSSSMTNPQLFIMTWGGIGLDFAIMRTVMALLFGMLVGVIAYFVPDQWMLKGQILEQQTDEGAGSNCNPKTFSWGLYFRNILKSLEYIGLYIVIGVMIGSAIEVLIPGKVAQYMFQSGTLQSVLVASLVSIPTFVCGGGAVPLIASLMESGMSKGAAAAYFNVGSATRIQSILSLAALFKPLCLIFYVLLLIVFSLAAGIVVQ